MLKRMIYSAAAVAALWTVLAGMASRGRAAGGWPGNMVFFFFAAFALAVGAAFYFSWKRKKDLEQLALSSGLAFDPDALALPDTGRLGLELFTHGHSRKARNLFVSSGAGAENIYLFDHTYVTGSGKNRHTHSFTPALFRFPGAGFPLFELRPENLLDQIGEMVGFRDIDIDGFPVFSDKYRLTGPDEAAVRAFFSPAAVSWLELNPGWRIQAAGDYMAVFKKKGLVPAADYLSYIEETRNLAASITRK